MFQKSCLELYFIMGSPNTKQSPKKVLEAAIEGGITCFQYREKGPLAKQGKERVQLGKTLRELCADHQIPFVVNDDVDLAIELQADGLHIGQDDAPIEEVKKKLPQHCFVGVSTSTIEESLEAEKTGADYIGVGPIFQTKTKKDALEPIGLLSLQAIREATSLPIVAISGINTQNVASVVNRGADGVALISAISQAEDPLETARLLRENIKQAKK